MILSDITGHQPVNTLDNKLTGNRDQNIFIIYINAKCQHVSNDNKFMEFKIISEYLSANTVHSNLRVNLVSHYLYDCQWRQMSPQDM